MDKPISSTNSSSGDDLPKEVRLPIGAGARQDNPSYPLENLVDAPGVKADSYLRLKPVGEVGEPSAQLPPVPPAPDRAPYIEEQPPENPQTEEWQRQKARLRQEVFLQKRRQDKRRRIWMGRVKILAQIVMTLAMVAGFYFFAAAGFWRFNPLNTNVDNQWLLSRPQLAMLLQPFSNEHLFRVDPSKVEQRLKIALPLVDRVIVRRHLFPYIGMNITLIPKHAWALVVIPMTSDPQSINGAGQLIAANLGTLPLKPPITDAVMPAGPPYEPPDIFDLTVSQQIPKASRTTSPSITGDDPIAPNASNIEAAADNAKSVASKQVHFKVASLLYQQNSIAPIMSEHLTKVVWTRLGQPMTILSNSTSLPEADLGYYRSLVTMVQSPEFKNINCLYIDARQPDDIYLVFPQFKARLGRLDSTVMERAARLVVVTPDAIAKHKELAYVDLRWQHQLIFKKRRNGHQVAPEPTVTDPPQ